MTPAELQAIDVRHDNVTRWAFLVIDLNGPTMFEVHRPGCRDLRKSDRIYAIGPTGRMDHIPPAAGPTEAEIADVLARTFYGGDPTTTDASDVRRMPCLAR